MSDHIDVRDEGAVRTIRFDRQERRNAFDGPMLEALREAVEGAAATSGLRSIVLRGAGEDFSTGADLNLYRDYGALDVRTVNERTWMAVFESVERTPLPVVASVSGWCIAGGTELVLACDLVVAGRGARFGLTEARVGVIPGAGASVRLSRWVGRAAAKELLMIGEPIDAAEAHRLGLVNRLVDDGDLDDATATFAAQLASRSPLALAAAKRAVNVGSEMELSHGIRYALQEFALLFAGEDQREGMSAFLEKRSPNYTGR